MWRRHVRWRLLRRRHLLQWRLPLQSSFCGSDCSEKCCPNDCSGHGRVSGGRARRVSLRSATAARTARCACPNDCSSRGASSSLRRALANKGAWSAVCGCHAGFGFDCRCSRASPLLGAATATMRRATASGRRSGTPAAERRPKTAVAPTACASACRAGVETTAPRRCAPTAAAATAIAPTRSSASAMTAGSATTAPRRRAPMTALAKASARPGFATASQGCTGANATCACALARMPPAPATASATTGSASASRATAAPTARRACALAAAAATAPATGTRARATPGGVGPRAQRRTAQRVSGPGLCSNGTCFCGRGTGLDCSVRACPNDRTAHGVCEDFHCVCDPGSRAPTARRACGLSVRARLLRRRDALLRGRSRASVHRDALPQRLQSQRRLRRRRLPLPRWLLWRRLLARRLSADCSGNGECGANGTCTCFEGFGGPDCALATCSAACVRTAGATMACHRNPGLRASTAPRASCERLLGPRRASSKRACATPAGPPPTAQSQLPGDCNGNGLCIDGKCHCSAGYGGRLCPRSSANGLARSGCAARPRARATPAHVMTKPRPAFCRRSPVRHSAVATSPSVTACPPASQPWRLRQLDLLLQARLVWPRPQLAVASLAAPPTAGATRAAAGAIWSGDDCRLPSAQWPRLCAKLRPHASHARQALRRGYVSGARMLHQMCQLHGTL